MRVGLDATCFDDRPSGANQRFRHLYGAVIRQNPDVIFVVYEAADAGETGWYRSCPNVIVRPTPLPSRGRIARVFRGLRYWRRALSRDALDLFETFTLPLVVAPDCPTILTIHDLRGARADRPLPGRWLARGVLRHAFAHAARVIVVSDTIRGEVLALRPGTPVSTIYNGVCFEALAPDSPAAAAVARHHGLDSPFVLTVGHLEARKNLTMLVEAFALLRDDGHPRRLAIVGNDGGERAAIEGAIVRLAMEPWVTLVAEADDVAVRALYAACALVVIPSRYEGFGIPLIEAMAAHRPLATSDIPVFRELTLGNGWYFPVDSPRAMAEAIDRLMRDPAACARLVAQGDLRVGDFAFDRLARQVSALHAEVITAAP